MNWTERARNWVKKQLNINAEAPDTTENTTIENFRTQYTDTLRTHWQTAHEAYLNDSDEPEFPFAAADRDDTDLPDAVKEAIRYYVEQIERNDIGSVQLYKYAKAFIVSTSTDGDDGWVELYAKEGTALGYGRTFIEIVSWGEKDTIRKMTMDSSFPADMADRFERTLWREDTTWNSI